ncbi:hypothetical protein MNB_SM-4-936 [hydrothermal vent metagenome]|uniref:Uncharacterized protein n=1 Tax=hydrothermal vent metagenome TaxID=652676 RepID=A0A1W1BUW3_9ZZZZ
MIDKDTQEYLKKDPYKHRNDAEYRKRRSGVLKKFPIDKKTFNKYNKKIIIKAR